MLQSVARAPSRTPPTAKCVIRAASLQRQIATCVNSIIAIALYHPLERFPLCPRHGRAPLPQVDDGSRELGPNQTSRRLGIGLMGMPYGSFNAPSRSLAVTVIR